MTRQPFKLHLPGLLKVLAEHLYANKQVAVRELIQNAHDSCLRRRVKGSERDFSPRIDIAIDRAASLLRISDNGSGLTAEEIESYLATIGRSYTRELRESLALLSADEAAKLIGQFGFGFLSAFLIASEVTVITRSMHSEAPAVRWHSSGDEYYEVLPATREQIGTTIELLIKPNAAFVLQKRLLIEALQQYADFLPIPIYLNDELHPINLMAPPWEQADPTSATLDYIERAFQTSEPLCIIQLHDQTVDLGHDSLTIPLEGFLFVPPSSVASVREYGDLRVYIRRMFITDQERDLLPPWARFIRGVVDCPLLQPTASREDLHQDDTFESVRQALEEQLSAGLRYLAQNEPAVWRQIVRGHSDVITGWAVRDHEFFAQVADLVTFRTTRGYLSLPAYLELTQGTLYYVTKELGSLQEQVLAEGHDVPVIDASWFAVAPFLEKYAAHHNNLELIRLDGEASKLLRLTNDPAFAHLVSSLRERNVRARVASFNPSSMPAVMLYPQDADFMLEGRRAVESGDLADPLAAMVGDYLQRSGSDVDLTGTLYLNAANPLVRRLADTPATAHGYAPALSLIYQIARVFAGRTLTAADAAAAFAAISAAIEEVAL